MAEKSKIAKEKSRLSASERRAEIIRMAIPLFASQGFRGVTTKMLAKAAGISEGLLYQHFASKEAIYEEVQDNYCKPPKRLKSAVEGMEPGTPLLILVFYSMARVIIEKPAGLLPDPLIPRLMLHSLTEDGTFARMFIKKMFADIFPKIEAAIAASRASGDMVEDHMPDPLRFWLSHHVVMGVSMFLMPDEPVVDYGMAKGDAFIDCTVRYILRGLGLKEEAIAKHYDRDALKTFMTNLINSEDSE